MQRYDLVNRHLSERKGGHMVEDSDGYFVNYADAQAVRALATEPGTRALAEIVKKAVDAETRACAQICDRNDQVGGCASQVRAHILARLDQRKEATL